MTNKKRHTGGIERFFDVLRPDDIRIKGHRIGIEDLLLLYRDGFVLEQLAVRFPTLTTAEIGATLRYYELNRERIDRYLDEGEERYRRARQAQRDNPPEALRGFLERVAVLRRRADDSRGHVSGG
jgi:uncharacterized protein (DUF433 family)